MPARREGADHLDERAELGEARGELRALLLQQRRHQPLREKRASPRLRHAAGAAPPHRRAVPRRSAAVPVRRGGAAVARRPRGALAAAAVEVVLQVRPGGLLPTGRRHGRGAPAARSGHLLAPLAKKRPRRLCARGPQAREKRAGEDGSLLVRGTRRPGQPVEHHGGGEATGGHATPPRPATGAQAAEAVHPRGGRWELRPRAALQHDRPAVVQHALVHERAVAIALDVLVQTLGQAPADDEQLLAGRAPAAAVELGKHALGAVRTREVHKGVTEIPALHEVDWQVEKIVLASEASRVEVLLELVTREVEGDVPDCHRRLRLLAHLVLHLHALLGQVSGTAEAMGRLLLSPERQDWRRQRPLHGRLRGLVLLPLDHFDERTPHDDANPGARRLKTRWRLGRRWHLHGSEEGKAGWSSEARVGAHAAGAGCGCRGRGP
mmetsp:Transcript_110864/g.300881  ORF Transcript_110864/g.300881 Transcript_110864/m.300881 type:complete len:437 (+) Transcript_110864:180-1490(+)